MVFIDNLKRELEENKRKIRVKAPLSLTSGTNWAELNVTSLNGSPVMLSASMDNLKFRFQPLASGSICVPLPYRLDSHGNKPLHQHFDEFESSADARTLSEALLMILGSDYKFLGGFKK